MKVKIQSIYAKGSVTARPGDVLDVSKTEAEQLVKGRFAEYMNPIVKTVMKKTTESSTQKKKEMAIKPQGEKAVKE